ncbi:ORF6N domain-containing protein [Bilophila wadsworthia]|jgi:hypothetical protein|uniref:ORF6N domain-containing protein n=1 Tax=Bilophila wadsworthia TaxID=35833 RepID=UPI002062DF1D|nr:MAG TPA: hypothetical protein [Caudoviricetes sp.]
MSQLSTPSLPRLAYKGIPVVTTESLAQAYEVEAKQIRQNFANNKERFTEGKHFYSLSGNELRGFKHSVEIFDSVKIARNVNALTLWTERGAARHAKMLNSDRAWDMFELLEETFFRIARPEPAPAPSPISKRTDPERKALTAIINTWVGMAPIHYASARAQVNAHFGVASVDALTVAQVKDAIRWVQGKIDALPTPPASAPARTLPVSNIYRDRVKELERLEAKFMEFAGETRSRLSELNAEYIRLNQGAFAALLRTLPAAHPGDVDRLSSALSAQSYDAYNWIDAGLSRMRLAIVSARAANRIMG